MTDPNPPTDTDTAEFVSWEQFRDGLPHGRFRVVVNPELARRFVAQRVNAVPVAIAILGCGIAVALAGHSIVGIAMVAVGIVFRRAIRWQAPKILLQLASRQRAAYYDATTSGVMEVRRT